MTTDVAGKVLTIDDEEAIRNGFRNYLEDYDYEVLTAENGRKGMEVFDQQQPDLVLVDLRMPEMDGLEVLARIKKTSPDTPVIVVSGTGIMSDAVEALRLGAWNFLLKPVTDLSVLLHAVRKGIDQKRLVMENRRFQQHLQEEVTRRTQQLEQANDQLQQSRENLAITLDSIGDGVIATDSEGMITRMNPVAESLTGWLSSEATGGHLAQVFRILDPVSRQPRGNPLDLEIKALLVARDDTEHHIAMKATSIRNKSQQVVGTVLVFRDITRQLELEEQLRQSRKMDAIGQLAGGIAHDFNNMLAGIIGAADMLSLKLRDNKSLSKYSAMIRDAGNRAAELTQKLLDFSRKKQPTCCPVDMHQSIRETARILERTDKRIEITCNFTAHSFKLTGDPAQLENTILNLGINARDAMPEGGSITITTANVELDDRYCSNAPSNIKPGLYLEVCVADTGIGIPPRVMDRIFEPFFTTKAPGKGTGLGLASVYSAVRNHQGDIRVYSQPGNGSTFKLYLPVNRPGLIETLPGAEDERIIYGTGRILVVDDEQLILDISKAVLNDLGYDVVLASGGRNAVDIYKRQHLEIDMVLLDMVMPKMNGRDTYAALAEINPNVIVVLTSGFAPLTEARGIDIPGVAAFIKKPFRRGELSRKIHDAICTKNNGVEI